MFASLKSLLFFGMAAVLMTPIAPVRAQPAGESNPVALRNGVPEAWLIGGIHDGRAGVSIYGLDTETILRANAGDPYLSSQMMDGVMRAWQPAATAANGVTVIEPKTAHSYGWSRGTGYAQIYVQAEKPTTVVLHWRQSGVQTSGWLDGRPFALADDANPPADFPKTAERAQAPMKGLTTEGLVAIAMPEKSESPKAATLELGAGWHCLLVKMVMQHDQGETFFFAAKFTDPADGPADSTLKTATTSLKTQLSDPTADLKLHAQAAKLRPWFFVDAPGNLVHPGEPLKIAADIRWHRILEEKALQAPIEPFDATLRLRLVSFDGREVATREIKDKFPGQFAVDFGAAPEAGYYAIYPSLHTADGKLIWASYADGFTVVRGVAAQRERLDQKKVWNNNYYFFDDEKLGLGISRPGELMNWLERSGVFQNIGSFPGNEEKYQPLWEEAQKRGLNFFADTAGDDPKLNESQADGERCIAALAKYTRFSKCYNEIDIHSGERYSKLREPKHWVERAKWEYEAAHRARPDAHYVGGSIVRGGDFKQRGNAPGSLGPGLWFAECLKLGLDQYHDAWDVHQYPQNPPRLDGPFGNSGSEDERGVLAAYRLVGRENKLPFWMGECGAKAAHCATGRRGQADLAAKMIAWVNHRSDYLGIAFCIGNEYDWARGRLWDYSMGHKPGEAAMITASALIDGLPYQAVQTGDANVQAGWFGDTYMIWRTDDSSSQWSLKSDKPGPWVAVDVVGATKPVETVGDALQFTISQSPVYILPLAEYERLTRTQLPDFSRRTIDANRVSIAAVTLRCN